MPGLSASEIITEHDEYARRRDAYRAEMIPLRAARRIRVGDTVSLEFENVDTLRYQVQEMVFVERLQGPAEVAGELEAYQRMLPTSHELGATLFLELSDAATAKAELARLAGIQHAVAMRVGDATIPGVELPSLDDSDGPETSGSQTASVHMLRFRLTDAQRDDFRDPAVPVEVVVDHPEYSDATPVTGRTRLSLLADLALDH